MAANITVLYAAPGQASDYDGEMYGQSVLLKLPPRAVGRYIDKNNLRGKPVRTEVPETALAIIDILGKISGPRVFFLKKGIIVVDTGEGAFLLERKRRAIPRAEALEIRYEGDFNLLARVVAALTERSGDVLYSTLDSSLLQSLGTTASRNTSEWDRIQGYARSRRAAIDLNVRALKRLVSGQWIPFQAYITNSGNVLVKDIKLMFPHDARVRCSMDTVDELGAGFTARLDFELMFQSSGKNEMEFMAVYRDPVSGVKGRALFSIDVDILSPGTVVPEVVAGTGSGKPRIMVRGVNNRSEKVSTPVKAPVDNHPYRGPKQSTTPGLGHERAIPAEALTHRGGEYINNSVDMDRGDRMGKPFKVEKIVEEDKEIEIIHEDATEYERQPIGEDDDGYFCPYCQRRIHLPVPPKMCPWCHREFLR